MRARYYDSASGRFISEDPGYYGTNWYLYCLNNPVSLVDPKGRTPVGDVATGIGVSIAMGQIRALLAFIAYARSGPDPEDLENAYGALMAGMDNSGAVSNWLNAISAVDLGVDLLSANYLSALSNYMSISLSARAELGVYLIAYAVRLEYYADLMDREY